MKELIIFLVCWNLAITSIAVFQGFFIHSPKFREWLKEFFFNMDNNEKDE